MSNAELPHLLFYGPRGSGKKTRIACLLQELFGTGASRVRLQPHELHAPSGRKIEFTTLDSNHHIELNPSDAGFYDRVVVQEIVKTTAQAAPVAASGRVPLKLLVIHDAELLSRDAQFALRRTIEKCSAQCRLILCCSSLR